MGYYEDKDVDRWHKTTEQKMKYRLDMINELKHDLENVRFEETKNIITKEIKEHEFGYKTTKSKFILWAEAKDKGIKTVDYDYDWN